MNSPINSKNDLNQELLDDYHQSLLQLKTLIGSSNIITSPIYIRLKSSIWNEQHALAWLSQQNHWPKVYFAERNKSFGIAGVLDADLQISNDSNTVAEVIRSLTKDRYVYVGGHEFLSHKYSKCQNNGESSPWDKWPKFSFVAPILSIIKKNDNFYICFQPKRNLDDKKLTPQQNWLERFLIYLQEQIISDINFLSLEHQSCEAENLSKQVNEIHPTYCDKNKEFNIWESSVNTVLRMIDSAQINKIVLSRETTIHSDKAPYHSAFEILGFLQSFLPNSYPFLFALTKESIFIGCSPESLMKAELSNNSDYWKISTESLAGSAPSSDSSPMTHDKKLTLEHDIVTTGIRKTLQKFSFEIDEDHSVSEISMPHIKHLYLQFNAKIKDLTDLINCIIDLHPTAAVCGVPKDIAIKKIIEIENHKRGWYSGFIGVVGCEQISFSVAIRSALCEMDKIMVYAGVGLVNGSTPISEWHELDIKSMPFVYATKTTNKSE